MNFKRVLALVLSAAMVYTAAPALNLGVATQAATKAVETQAKGEDGTFVDRTQQATWTYTVSGGAATITGYSGGLTNGVVVPNFVLNGDSRDLKADGSNGTKVTAIKLATTGVNSLNLSGNSNLEQLDVSGSTSLTGITFGPDNKKIVSINASNTGLTALELDNLTGMESLDVSNCAALTTLTYKGAEKSTKLKYLNISNDAKLGIKTDAGKLVPGQLNISNFTCGLESLLAQNASFGTVQWVEGNEGKVDFDGSKKTEDLAGKTLNSAQSLHTVLAADGAGNKTLLSIDLSGSYLGSVYLNNYDKLYQVTATGMNGLSSVELDDCDELVSMDFSNAGRFFQSFFVKGAGKNSYVKGTLDPDKNFDTRNMVTIKLEGDTYLQNFAIENSKVVDGLQTYIDAIGDNLRNAYIVKTGASTLSFEKNTKLEGIYASDNELVGGIVLPEAGSTIKYLVAENSALTAIKNLGKQTQIEALDVSGNFLTSMDSLAATGIHDVNAVDKLNDDKTWGQASYMDATNATAGAIILPAYKGDNAKGVLAKGDNVDRLDISGNLLNSYPAFKVKDGSNLKDGTWNDTNKDAQATLPFDFAVVQTDLVDGNETSFKVDIKDDDIVNLVKSHVYKDAAEFSPFEKVAAGAERYSSSVQTSLVRVIKNDIIATVKSDRPASLSFDGKDAVANTMAQLNEVKAKATSDSIDRKFNVSIVGENVAAKDAKGADIQNSEEVNVRRTGTQIAYYSTVDQYKLVDGKEDETELTKNVFAQTGTPLYFKARTNYYVNGVADDAREIFEDYDVEVSGVEATVEEEKEVKVGTTKVKYGFYKITPKTAGTMTVKVTGKVSGESATYTSTFQVSRAGFTAAAKNAYTANPNLKEADKRVSVMTVGETAKVVDPNNADATVTFVDYNVNVANPAQNEEESNSIISLNNVDGTIYAKKSGFAVVHCVSSLGGSYDMWVYVHPKNMGVALTSLDGKNAITIDANSFDTATQKPAQLVVTSNVLDRVDKDGNALAAGVQAFNLVSNSSVESARGDKRFIKFVSSDPSIVEVDKNGLLTYKKPGTATVTAYTLAHEAQDGVYAKLDEYKYKTTADSFGKNKAYADENVNALQTITDKVAATGAAFSPAYYEFTVTCGEATTPTITAAGPAATMIVGATETIKPTAAGYSKNDSVKFTFESLNTAVATVDATTGVVTAVAPGEAKIKITGVESGQTASAEVTVKVGKDINGVTVNGLEASYSYDGKAVEPKVSLAEGTYALQEGTDYTVAFTNNTAVGKATVTFTGMGQYTGTMSKEFEIKGQSIAGGKIALSKSKLTYTGKAQKVTVTVTDAAGNKVDATAANLTIKGNSMTKPGKQTVTVTDAAGNKLTATLKMVPKKVTGVKVANVKGAKAKISFTKAVGATKYQVKYTVAGASAKTTKITKNAVTVKVTKGKKVTAQVRAYSAGGWGAWSAKKAFTTDKK